MNCAASVIINEKKSVKKYQNFDENLIDTLD